MSLRRRPILLLLLSGPALAQTQRQTAAPIYRCGPQGREIRDRPCPAEPGASASVAFDQPSERDRAAAQKRQAADAQQAARLQRERERFEAAPRPEPGHAPQASPAVAEPGSAPARSRGRRKPAKDGKTRTVRAPAAQP